MRATRRGLLVLGAASVLAPPPALAQGRSDVDVLEELYALEAQLADGYQAALRRGALPEAVARRLLAQEREHARGLERALTARGRADRPAAEPAPELRRALRDRAGLVRYLLELEARAVRAYANAAAGLRDEGLRQPLGAIMGSEAQHEVALREALGEPLLGV